MTSPYLNLPIRTIEQAAVDMGRNPEDYGAETPRYKEYAEQRLRWALTDLDFAKIWVESADRWHRNSVSIGGVSPEDVIKHIEEAMSAVRVLIKGMES